MTGVQTCALPILHAVGSKFVVLDGPLFQIALPPQYIGHPFYVKLQSFNIYNTEVQDLSTAVPYYYTPMGIGFGIQVFGGNGSIVANAVVI